jgi:hypothetical protein
MLPTSLFKCGNACWYFWSEAFCAVRWWLKVRERSFVSMKNTETNKNVGFEFKMSDYVKTGEKKHYVDLSLAKYELFWWTCATPPHFQLEISQGL